MTLFDSIRWLFSPSLSMRDVQRRYEVAVASADALDMALCEVVMFGQPDAITMRLLNPMQAVSLGSICMRNGSWNVTLAHLALVRS